MRQLGPAGLVRIGVKAVGPTARAPADSRDGPRSGGSRLLASLPCPRHPPLRHRPARGACSLPGSAAPDGAWLTATGHKGAAASNRANSKQERQELARIVRPAERVCCESVHRPATMRVQDKSNSACPTPKRRPQTRARAGGAASARGRVAPKLPLAGVDEFQDRDALVGRALTSVCRSRPMSLSRADFSA